MLATQLSVVKEQLKGHTDTPKDGQKAAQTLSQAGTPGQLTRDCSMRVPFVTGTIVLVRYQFFFPFAECYRVSRYRSTAGRQLRLMMSAGLREPQSSSSSL